MKKNLFLLFITLSFTLYGCANNAPAPSAKTTENSSIDTTKLNAESSVSGDVFEIKEKMFIAQCNDIYLNPSDYETNTIKIEGAYNMYTDEETGKTYYSVTRKGPGCCGNDGIAGFEFYYDGDMPKINDWIEVMRKIEMIKDGDETSVVLRLSKLTVLTERGAEFVSN